MTGQHVVMWSGGITSWATARHVIAEHGTDNVTLLFADTLVEDPDLYAFNAAASTQLGVPITRVADGRDPWQVFEDKRWLGNTRIAQCSLELKLKVCATWLDGKPELTFANTTLYVGIDWTETERLPAIISGWAPWTVDAPLTRPPYRDKRQLLAEARALGLPMPRLYELGFAHNNCGGACVKGGQAQWARLLRIFPERYARAEAAEERMRALLGKDVSILRDRTGGGDEAAHAGRAPPADRGAAGPARPVRRGRLRLLHRDERRVTARTWRPDGPGSFQAPTGVRTVTDRTGRRWTRSRTRWTCTGSHFIRWRELVAEHGPVTEVTTAA